MSEIISDQEYLKLKESNSTYLVLGIVFVLIMPPLGVVFLILALVNSQKIQKYEEHQRLQNPSYQSGTQVTVDGKGGLPPNFCPNCNAKLEEGTQNAFAAQDEVFCSYCGSKLK